MNELLRLEHIQKYYGNQGNLTKAINDISFSVSAGEFVGIMGASGSGKTTLLNCISTIDTVSAGHIYLKDTDVTEIRQVRCSTIRLICSRLRTKQTVQGTRGKPGIQSRFKL